MATKQRVKHKSESGTGSRRSSQQTFRGEMVQLRLLRVDERYRSHLLYEQIRAFEDKVYLSYEQFNVDVLHRMFVELAKRTVVDIRKVKTISMLRQCFKDLKKLIRCKLRHRQVKTTPEEEKIVKYFTWFFQYLNYIRELRANFEDRIYTPLFTYFYNIGYDQPERENSADSENPSPSVLSFRSLDSGYSGLSGLTSILADGDKVPYSARSRSEFDDSQNSRRRIITKNALLVLGREFQDIKQLYDTTEIENLGQRMSHLKDRIDYLLDNEARLENEILSQDSERAVFHLKIRPLGNENMMRFVPDVLLKFQKAAWLARRWLEKDDEKTKDLNAKLEKLTVLEVEMNKRLSSLSREIEQQEMELESQADVLNKLLTREERSNNLGQSMFDLNKRKDILNEQLNNLSTERGELCKRLTEAHRNNDRKTYKQLRPLYERNKLQRFALERQIATLNYHLNITGADQSIELDVKASVIHNTNDVQDKCEEIEQRIEKARKVQKAIQTALIPISKDKNFIKDQIQIKEGHPIEMSKPAIKAEFVASKNDPDRLVDLNADFLGRTAVGNPVSLFITSLPDEGNTTPVSKAIKTIDTSSQRNSRQYVPELLASEW